MMTTKKYTAAALAALLLALSMTGCGEANSASTGETPQAVNLTAEIEPQTVSGTEPDAEFLSAQTAFALKLMQETAAAKPDENLLISPYSMMQALAMTANGADGETLTEMEQTLGGIPIDALDSYLYYQRTTLPQAENSKCLTANSVWFRDEGDRIQVWPGFLQKMNDYYAAECFAEPFDTETKDKINAWCSDQTDGMIPELLDKIEPAVVMYLINAVCFDAKWAHPYEDEPYPLDFHALNGAAQKAQMMASDEYRYLEDAHSTGFVKNYEGGGYAFAAILPEEGMTPTEYLAQLSPDGLRDLLLNAKSENVRAVLPQFSYDFDHEYSAVLTDMGMPSAFLPDADFSRMAKTASGELFISRVLHKTHIDVDTEGTRAAAISAVEMTEEAAAEYEEQKLVILDRPFVYMIVDTATNLPVFFGVLNAVE